MFRVRVQCERFQISDMGCVFNAGVLCLGGICGLSVEEEALSLCSLKLACEVCAQLP